MSMATYAKKVTPDWAKELSRPLFRGVGRATASKRSHPDFLIIGTKRGGTTSLFKYLMRHPAVLPMWPGVENAKKTFYFDQNWHKGDAWYRSHFPTEQQRERVRQEYGVRGVTGEAAPYYVFHPLVLERVRATMPQVKVVMLVRDPVDRIWSHYHERVRMGTESLGFREALEAEESRLAGEEERIRREPGYYSERHDFCSYLARGRYLDHLGPWLDAFGDQVHVVRSEDLYTDPAATLVAAHRFLGLPEAPPESPHRYNYVPTKDITPEDRAWLTDYYRPHVEALEERLGRSFGWHNFSTSPHLA
jgi:hypothetical protein